MRRPLTVLGLLAPSLALSLVGAPAAEAAPSTSVMVAEVYGGGGNAGATLTRDFIELGNAGSTGAPIAGWSVQYLPASPTASSLWQVTPLGGTVPAGGRYLVGEGTGAGGTTPLPTTDASGTIAMGATGGTVALVNTTTPLTCKTAADCAADSRIIDLVGYGTAVVRETTPAAATSNTTSAARPALTDTDNNAADFVVGTPTPQNTSDIPPPPPPTCADPATQQIAQVQGSAASTPFAGQNVRVEGVVTGDFNDDATGLGGFYIQDDTPDTDPATSEGIFVTGSAAVAEGDRVLVSGNAGEGFDQTQIAATTVNVCGTGTIAALVYDLPRPEGVTFEPVESMLLTFPEALTATEHFQLGRFGEITVSSDGRLFQPTDRVEPGAEATALLAESLRRALLIDDGSNVQNPSSVPYLEPEAVRIGDTTTGATGVLGFGFSRFRLQPTDAIAFTRTNPRPAAPAPVGGDITVASFNTLNYFTTLTSENPDARGANSATEFARQQVKEVEAITGLDADVVGLMEIENNGAEAVGSLVDALNAATAPGTYAAIVEPAINDPNEFGGTFGTDAIKVALIYRPAAVTPVGAAQTSTAAIFDRPPLIQTFERIGGSEDVTVVVNHFKSKGSCPASGVDADQGDGQSCWNAKRILQAEELVATLDTLGAPNPLIIGDLNSYTQEDPIDVLEEAGYTGLSEAFVEEDDRYSFVFDGFSGELDHALAGGELLDNVTGTTIWHINADEPLILDYNLDFGRDPSLYEANEFRSSDHDPLLVGLTLRADSVPAAPSVTAVAGWNAVTVEWDEPDDGGVPISGYTVTVLDGDTVVASVDVGPDVRAHTFGGLLTGVTYQLEVAATNALGTGEAGTDDATPFVPATYVALDAGVDCPSFTVTNANAFPIAFDWKASTDQAGSGVAAADSTVAVDVAFKARGTTAFVVLVAGKAQDTATGRCVTS
jgi:predicted extracellular nuclease